MKFTHFIRGGIDILDLFSCVEKHLSGYVKSQNTRIWSAELKQNIELCTSNVNAETLHRVASNIRKRLNACIAERGGHFQY
jgi:hypothetical protein